MLNYKKLSPDECEFVAVASVGEVPPGQRLFLDIDDEAIVIFNIAGTFFAIGNLCSHDDGPLGDGALENTYEISCPRHGAHFDVRSGKALSLPAIEDIPAYPIRVRGDDIEIGLPVQ